MDVHERGPRALLLQAEWYIFTLDNPPRFISAQFGHYRSPLCLVQKYLIRDCTAKSLWRAIGLRLKKLWMPAL